MIECKYSINDILDKIVGHTDIACDSYYDEVSGENLQTLNDIMWWCIDRLHYNAKYIGDYRESANSLANQCIRYCDSYKENIDYICQLKELNKESEK